MKDIHVRVEDELFDKTKTAYPYYGGMQEAVSEALEFWHKNRDKKECCGGGCDD